MKRVYCFVVLVFMLCLPNLVSGQLPKGVHIPVGKGTQGAPESRGNGYGLDGCELTYNFTLAVFNLDLLNLDLPNGEAYSDWNFGDHLPPDLDLPEEYGPMYLKCELNGTYHVFEVESFYFAPLFIEGKYAFVYDHSITIDIREDCDGEDDNAELEYIVKMSLFSDTGALYPLCDYTEPNDLFDCDYLPTMCPMPTCDNSYWVEWQDTISVKCGDDCKMLEAENVWEMTELEKVGSNIESRNYSDKENENSIGLEIYPNPFSTELIFKWKGTHEDSTMRLYNTNGQLMKTWTASMPQAGEIFKISTGELPNGVYFLLVERDGKTTHHKLIKT